MSKIILDGPLCPQCYTPLRKTAGKLNPEVTCGKCGSHCFISIDTRTHHEVVRSTYRTLTEPVDEIHG
jgi:hypothetical protein